VLLPYYSFFFQYLLHSYSFPLLFVCFSILHTFTNHKSYCVTMAAASATSCSPLAPADWVPESFDGKDVNAWSLAELLASNAAESLPDTLAKRISDPIVSATNFSISGTTASSTTEQKFGAVTTGMTIEQVLQLVVDGSDATDNHIVLVLLSKSEIKKRKKAAASAAKKAAKKAAAAKKKEADEQKRLEEAKSIVLQQDEKLPAATLIRIKQVAEFDNQRVKVSGWAHTIRTQGSIMFVDLRDGSSWPVVLQCVLTNDLAKTYDAITLKRESTLSVYGTLKKDDRAPGGYELQCDYWELISMASADLENLFNKDSHPDVLADNRHLQLRLPLPAAVMKCRSLIVQEFRNHFFKNDYFEVTPPTVVQTEVEGGSNLFELDYFGEVAYMTQSSQLYLETVVPSMGKVFCIAPSYRAEKSRTRRHVAEYTHCEAELGFITFEDLLVAIEDLVVDVSNHLVESCGDMLTALNPDFKPISKPIKRMDYADAIKFCREHNIYKDKETKTYFEFGDDIPEGPERQMTDMIGEPILLMRFPARMKAFYMSRCEEDNKLTESVDLLMPNVGEIVGGSMRMWKYDELMDAYKREKLSPEPYYWYTDQRKFGGCPHGGYGLGIERFLCWALGRYHIREVCLYPRTVGRCKP
jgi:asparaginyl-tRNA synthetase